MGYTTDLAKEFKARNNTAKIGTVQGSVLSINPFIIGILDNEFMADNTNSFICKTISDLITNNELNINDKVLVISSENSQTFFIVDKIV